MKKWAVIVIAVLLIMSLAGCSAGKPQSTEPAETPAAPEVAKRISIATAGTGGSYYPIGTAIADIINQKVPGVQAKSEITGGAAENIQLVGSGQSDIGISTSYLTYFGINGMEPYKEKYSDLNILFTGFKSAPLQIITNKKSSINQVSDLKGKKVGLGPQGGASLLLIRDLFEFYGFKIEDVNASYTSYEDGAKAVEDGQLDAVIIGAADPTTSIQSLVANKFPLKMISISDADAKAFLAKYPYYGQYIIPKDMYSLDADVQVILMPNIMMVNKKLDEATVYNIVKAIFEDLDTLYATHPAAKAITLEGAAQQLGIPFHPGAEKYYREKGLI